MPCLVVLAAYDVLKTQATGELIVKEEDRQHGMTLMRGRDIVSLSPFWKICGYRTGYD